MRPDQQIVDLRDSRSLVNIRWFNMRTILGIAFEHLSRGEHDISRPTAATSDR